MTFASLRSFVIRHRFAIRDLSLVVAAFLLLLYCAYGIDLFENEAGIGLRQAEIELDEALLGGALLGLALLLVGLRHYLVQKKEVKRRIAAEQHVRQLAYQDSLTGLPNRRQFDDALAEAAAAPPREGASHAVLLLDLNGFKQINDVHGHGVGDEVLIVAAQRLLAAVRDGDMVARLGGDEFAILAKHLSDPEAAASIALRIIEAFESPIHAGGAIHRAGAGIGVALLPIDADTVTEALRKADVALYRAKAERRSAFRFFEAEMDARIQQRTLLEAALRSAIEEDRIEILFQPSVDLRTGQVTGFEAVPRWVDPELGEIERERFIAIADEVGLIHPLADHVLRGACEAARSWPPRTILAVDIYPSQLKDRLLPARIIRTLADSGIAPERLELEITESALVADMEHAREVLGALRAAGVRISLDNFGTGYSSLYHLRNFRLDKVKIDSSFIRAMAQEKEAASIVNALVGLGHGLGLTIAAEGVDGSDEQASLLDTGCEQGQGAVFSAAVSAKDAAALFGRPAMKAAR